MKRLFLLLAGALCVAVATAQNPASYFMKYSTLRSQLNPAFAPRQGYVNIPGLGGTDATVNGNIAPGALLFDVDGDLRAWTEGIVPDRVALAGLKDENIVGSGSRTNIIGFGAFRKDHKTFWAFDLNVRTQADTRMPYSFMEFVRQGGDVSGKNLGFSAEGYIEAAFTYSFPLVRDRMYLGVRAKLLAGMARMELEMNDFSMRMMPSVNDAGLPYWTLVADGALDVSLPGLDVRSDDPDRFAIDDLDTDGFAPVGWGAAVDLGITYDILPRLQASVAVNDLGFISWSKRNNRTARMAGSTDYVADGIDDPGFDVGSLTFERGDGRSTSRSLRATLYAGLEYELVVDKLSAGVLYSSSFWKYKTRHNFTASLNYTPLRWCSLAGTYSVVGGDGGLVGLALNLHPGWINFFVASDVLIGKHLPYFIPEGHRITNASFGIGIPMGRKSYRRPAWKWTSGR